MADFPASGRSGDGLETAFGCAILLLILAMIVCGIVAIGFMIHGVYVQDLWQVVGGGVALVVLLVIRSVSRAILS
jgi:hypothetical protein